MMCSTVAWLKPKKVKLCTSLAPAASVWRMGAGALGFHGPGNEVSVRSLEFMQKGGLLKSLEEKRQTIYVNRHPAVDQSSGLCFI